VLAPHFSKTADFSEKHKNKQTKKKHSNVPPILQVTYFDIISKPEKVREFNSKKTKLFCLSIARNRWCPLSQGNFFSRQHLSSYWKHWTFRLLKTFYRDKAQAGKSAWWSLTKALHKIYLLFGRLYLTNKSTSIRPTLFDKYQAEHISWPTLFESKISNFSLKDTFLDWPVQGHSRNTPLSSRKKTQDKRHLEMDTTHYIVNNKKNNQSLLSNQRGIYQEYNHWRHCRSTRIPSHKTQTLILS